MRAKIFDPALPRLTYEQQAAEISEISVDEGSTATYTVVPATEPSSPLTILLRSSDEASVTVSPSSLTFTVGTNGNWETAQTVTVTGVADDDEFDDLADIVHLAEFNSRGRRY